MFMSAVVVAASWCRPCRRRWQALILARERRPKRAVTIVRRAIVA
jgi:hypothetical protein